MAEVDSRIDFDMTPERWDALFAASGVDPSDDSVVVGVMWGPCIVRPSDKTMILITPGKHLDQWDEYAAKKFGGPAGS